jgi:two-component system, NarL family, nitrate/nitrite response regulator NarL
MSERRNGYEDRGDALVGPEQGTISTLIVSEHTLLREGMKSFLAGSRYNVCYEVSDIADALTLAVSGNVPHLIVIGANLNNNIVEPLKLLRAAFPESRIVFYAQSEGMATGDLIATFQAGIDGCLTSNASSHILRQSLELVMMGERIFPFALLKGSIPQHPETWEAAVPVQGNGISERERQVLRFLRDGHSNKLIARELKISEATVKVHVKMLLKKIGAANRTQAAIWAMNHLQPEEQA